MRKLFGWLPRSRGKRILALLGLGCGGLVLFLVALVVTAFFLWRSPSFQAWLWPRLMRLQATANLPAPPPVPPGPPYEGPSPNAAEVRTAGDIYRTTNVWTVRLHFTDAQWRGMGPNLVPGVGSWVGPDGRPVLRNPQATRAGIAGVLGLDYPWSQADVEFGGLTFTNVGIRFKGDGTFLAALGSYKRPYKIDLDRYHPGPLLAGRDSFSFNNLAADRSHLSDALAYELFRDAGVPASRTAYARLFLSIQGRFEPRLLGLYVMVEEVTAAWAEETFGVSGVALFKPVTYELFRDLGDDWQPYEQIYDPKTDLTEPQRRRLIELARLLTQAEDAALAARVGEFIDLDEFARFLAVEVLLAHYDGILAQGQNFFLYLDPRTNRFGFIPWDLDHAWGEFPFIGTAEQRERASIWHPWEGENRFLERMLAVPAFKDRYRAALETLLTTLFVPERLNRRIDEVAAVIRPAIAEESPDKLRVFEQAVASDWTDGPRDGNPFDERRPVHQLKRFIAARAQSVRAQLDGASEGLRVVRQPMR